MKIMPQKNINVNTYLWYSCSTGNTLQLQSHFTQPACSCLTNKNERTCARLAEGALLQSDNILWLLLELIQLIVFSPIRVWCGLVKQCQANWIKSLSFPGNEEEKGGTRSNATAFSFFLFFFWIKPNHCAFIKHYFHCSSDQNVRCSDANNSQSLKWSLKLDQIISSTFCEGYFFLFPNHRNHSEPSARQERPASF